MCRTSKNVAWHSAGKTCQEETLQLVGPISKLQKIKCGEYNPWVCIHNTSFLFVSYEWSLKAKVFVPAKPFQPSVMKESSLLCTLITYEENEG